MNSGVSVSERQTQPEKKKKSNMKHIVPSMYILKVFQEDSNLHTP